MTIHQLYFDDIPLPQAPAGQVWGVRCFPTGEMEPRQCTPNDIVYPYEAVALLRIGYSATVWLDEVRHIENLLNQARGILI